MSFYMLLLANEIDVAMVKQDSCKHCTENKLGTKILRCFRISKQDFKELKKNGCRGFNVTCTEDCTELELMKAF